jgi:cobalt-zinc-cadmium resistance protein CzcA
MIEKLVGFSVKNKLIVGLMTLAIAGGGIYSMFKLPLDAVPDITNNQVQIVTSSPSLASQEVEQFITQPLEFSMANIPGVEDIRSISRFGLSVITIVFEDDIPVLKARQYVKEQLDMAAESIPTGMGKPQMMPITTGLGEIYQYVLTVDPKFENQYNAMELRTIQDWIVKRQLMGTKGIIDVSSFGGFVKQYEVSIFPDRLIALNTTMNEVFSALEENNENSGGSYIEKGDKSFYIRTIGLVQTKEDISSIVIKRNGYVPVRIGDIAQVRYGSPPRFGAMTMDGKGEAVGGITLMLKGANSSEAISNVHEKIEKIEKGLPPGVHIYPYLDRSVLVGKAINTVSKNLIEGGLIVVFVLILLLGNFRAGLIVASIIPLSLLIAFIFMNLFGVSANLMSLGAIDFGIVVDGAVIVVEGVIHLLFANYLGKKLNQQEMDDAIIKTSGSIVGSAAFGVLIIVVVFIPIMTLSGIEGKMFKPMAQTVSFAILGALFLSMTYVPMMTALFLKKEIKEKKTIADRIMNRIKLVYKPILVKALAKPKLIISLGISLLVLSVFTFNQLGTEFVPTLDEGDLAMQVTIEPGSSLSKMVNTTSRAESILLKEFPEVKHVVSKIGTAEIPTDPMAVEDADVMILLKDKSEWVSATTREELANKMKVALSEVDDAEFNFTQPIQLRFNELISGSKTDVAIKLFGENLDSLAFYGSRIEEEIKTIKGAGDVKVEQTEGLPQLMVRYNRDNLSTYHVDVTDVNKVIRSAFAGEVAGTVYDQERRFDLVVRFNPDERKNLDLGKIFIENPDGIQIPLNQLASVSTENGAMMISRENAQRRISVGINVRNRDIGGFVEEVQQNLRKMKLPAGYFLEYGGQYENLQAAKARLFIVVPIALGLIFLLLYFAFGSVKYALLIYAAVPMSAVGGVLALLITGFPFSISAGVGFIALFGVAVLNGIVLISYINALRIQAPGMPLKDLVQEGSLARLRPVLMTAAVASLGFLPMALSTSSGAEVQKPLAIVVIGGLISATLLTLIVLPALYKVSHKQNIVS